jgi:transcription antitermination protein NusB
MAGPRRRSREIALQILHQIDVGGVTPESDADVAMMVARYFEHLAMKGGPAHEEDEDDGAADIVAKIDRPLVEELVRGVTQHWAEIDDTLTKLSQNWRLERMAIVERNVIRIALYELKYVENVPVNVVLNEAIELAKRYGTAEGAAFANGLLDRAVGELGVSRHR